MKLVSEADLRLPPNAEDYWISQTKFAEITGVHKTLLVRAIKDGSEGRVAKMHIRPENVRVGRLRANGVELRVVGALNDLQGRNPDKRAAADAGNLAQKEQRERQQREQRQQDQSSFQLGTGEGGGGSAGSGEGRGGNAVVVREKLQDAKLAVNVGRENVRFGREVMLASVLRDELIERKSAVTAANIAGTRVRNIWMDSTKNVAMAVKQAFPSLSLEKLLPVLSQAHKGVLQEVSEACYSIKFPSNMESTVNNRFQQLMKKQV